MPPSSPRGYSGWKKPSDASQQSDAPVVDTFKGYTGNHVNSKPNRPAPSSPWDDDATSANTFSDNASGESKPTSFYNNVAQENSDGWDKPWLDDASKPSKPSKPAPSKGQDDWSSVSESWKTKSKKPSAKPSTEESDWSTFSNTKPATGTKSSSGTSSWDGPNDDSHAVFSDFESVGAVANDAPVKPGGGWDDATAAGTDFPKVEANTPSEYSSGFSGGWSNEDPGMNGGYSHSSTGQGNNGGSRTGISHSGSKNAGSENTGSKNAASKAASYDWEQGESTGTSLAWDKDSTSKSSPLSSNNQPWEQAQWSQEAKTVEPNADFYNTHSSTPAVSSTTTSSGTSSGMSGTDIILVTVVGGLLLIGLVAIAAYMFMQRHKRKAYMSLNEERREMSVKEENAFLAAATSTQPRTSMESVNI